jgi:glycine amidinotransferase
MSTVVQSYTSWQPLEEVIVGRVHTPEYFSFIKNEKVRNQLGILLEETNEDLDNLQRTIEQFGTTVRRPELNRLDWFLRDREINKTEILLPPLTPRDWQITLGEKLLRVLNVPEVEHIVKEYKLTQPGSVIDPHDQGYNPDHPLVNCNASCIVRVGTDVFFDNSEWLTTTQMEWIRDNVLDNRYRVRRAITNGHGDAVFAILKPGVIISSMHDADLNYREDFPGWEVHKVWDSTIHAAMEVGKFKHENFNGRWWLQGHEPTEEFANFVDTWLTKWTGFVSETVFDVNCLVLDESHVIFSSYNKQVFDYCKKHHIEPIICDLRHKYFFDGGISCCTQDIRRRGPLETYF